MVLNSIQILTPCRHPNRALVFQAGGSSNHFAIRVPAGAVQSRARSSMGIGHGTARRVGLTCRRRPLRGGKGGHGPSSSPSPLGSVVPAATRTKRPGPHDTDGAGPAPQPQCRISRKHKDAVSSSTHHRSSGGPEGVRRIRQSPACPFPASIPSMAEDPDPAPHLAA